MKSLVRIRDFSEVCLRKSSFRLFFGVILALTILATGCSTKNEPSPATKSVVAIPKTLSFNSEEPESLDPAYTYSVESFNITQGIFEGLLRYKKGSMEVEPALATEWEISPDMKVYTFSLKKNVKFHDSTPFNANSVIYSFERQLAGKRDEKMSYASFIFDVVDSIEKVDDYKIRISLKDPSATFLANLAMYPAAPIIGDTAYKKNKDAFLINPVGTGPYKMVKYEKGKIIELAKNEDYWGEKAKIDKVSISLKRGEFADEISSLSNGKIDYMLLKSSMDIDKLNRENLLTTKVNQMATRYIAYNTSKKPFNNKNYRVGVSHLINRDEIIKLDSNFNGEKAETIIPQGIIGYNSKVKACDYDIEKAKDLLKDFPKNKEISIIFPFDTYKIISNQIAEKLTKVGIKATQEYLENEAYTDRIKSNNYDIAIDGWTSDNGDPDNFMFLLENASIESQLNVSKFSDPKFDEMLKQGRQTMNTEDRNVIYQKAEEYIAKENPVLPLYHNGWAVAYSNKLKNFYSHPSGVFLFQYFDKSN